jgi:hypothetical protein
MNETQTMSQMTAAEDDGRYIELTVEVPESVGAVFTRVVGALSIG